MCSSTEHVEESMRVPNLFRTNTYPCSNLVRVILPIHEYVDLKSVDKVDERVLSVTISPLRSPVVVLEHDLHIAGAISPPTEIPIKDDLRASVKHRKKRTLK